MGDGRLINRNYSYKSIGEGPRRADRENALFGARACVRASAIKRRLRPGEIFSIMRTAAETSAQSGVIIITCRNACSDQTRDDVNARTRGIFVSWSRRFDTHYAM